MGYQNMRFEGDYLVREWANVKPRLAAGETMDMISPVKVYRHRAVARAIASRIGGSGSVLEIGCGASLVVHEAAKLGLKCHAVDMDPLVLEYSAGLKQSYGSDVEFHQLDAFNLPFPEHSFDVVFSVGMLEHYSPEDQIELVKQHARFARRYVEIHIPNEGPDSCIHHLIKGHEDSHLPTDLMELARAAGLKDVVLDGRGLFVTVKGSQQNSPGYQEFVRTRFPQLWRDMTTADIELLIECDHATTRDERMKYGSIHYIVGSV